jgi:hypothetical protein
MTHTRDLDRVLDRWMDDGPTVVADRVIATAMTDVHTTRQRGARWVPLKELLMNRGSLAIGLGIIAVAVIAIAAYQALVGGTDVGSREDATRDPHEIVVTNDNAPEGWTARSTLRGREVLAYVIRYREASDATNGFLDGRATDLCAEGQGCATSWVAEYRSVADADAAFSLLHGEMLVGWGLGAHPTTLGLGEDEGYAYRNNLGNASATHAYVWRLGNLVMGVVGEMADLEGDPLRPFVEEMSARSR